MAAPELASPDDIDPDTRGERPEGASGPERASGTELREGAPSVGAQDSDGHPLQDDGVANPPEPFTDSQPLGVYAQWLTLGIALGLVTLQRPLDLGVQALTQHFPEGSHVAAFAALASLVCGSIERAKRDRGALGAISLLCAAAFMLLALTAPEWIRGYGTSRVWLTVFLLAGYSVFHLSCLEDWIAGTPGPRTRHAVATLHDLATARWWSWSSKVARLHRAQREAHLAALARVRSEEEAARLRAEDEAAKLEAERRAAEERIAAANALEEAAVAEQRAAHERSQADDAAHKAARVETARAEAEEKLASARKRTEELGRAADEAELARTRLRGEQLVATQLVLESAISAKAVAQRAMDQEVEVSRAQQLLEAALEELQRHGDGSDEEHDGDPSDLDVSDASVGQA